MMCHRLILVFPHVCKEFYPEYKDESATARAGNTRTEFLGRRSLASFIPPGYVGHSFLCYFLAPFLAQWLLSRTWPPAQPVTDEYSFISFTVYCLFWLCPLFSYLVGPKDKQATFTGRQQRAGVWILAFLVAGLFGPGTRRRPPPKKKARAAATPERRKGRHPESSRSRPARAPRAQTESVDADSEHSETDEDDQDVADLIESLLQSDASCRNQSAGGSDTSGGGSSAATSADDSDPTTPATARGTKQGEDDGGDGAVDEDIRSVSRNLDFDWVLYRTKFGTTPYKIAVTQLFVRYAHLVDRLVGKYHCRPPMTVAEAEEVAALARTFVLDYLTPVLGKLFSTKVHKLLAHVLAAIKLHGAISNGDTGGNEALHGHEKRRYGRTNGDEATFRTQLLRVGQGSLEIKARMAREAADFDDWFDDGGDEDESKAPAGTVGGDAAGAVRAGGAARRASTLALSELASRPGLSAVGSVLGQPAVTTAVRTANSYTFSPRFPCCDGGHPQQRLLAAPVYRGLPWYDCFAYSLPGDARGVVRYGEARSIVRSVGGSSTEVVVLAGMDVCESTPGCPLVGGGCVRLCWEMELGDEWPALHAVPLMYVLRVEHVVPDQEQITREYGIAATPKTVPGTAAHRRAARFFVNPFYPWP